MARQSWLDEVHNGLARAGLPSTYVLRLVGELADHADDAVAEAAQVPSPYTRCHRFGDVRQLIAFTVSQYRAKRLAGRRPMLFFLILPPLFALLLVPTALALGTWVFMSA